MGQLVRPVVCLRIDVAVAVDAAVDAVVVAGVEQLLPQLLHLKPMEVNKLYCPSLGAYVCLLTVVVVAVVFVAVATGEEVQDGGHLYQWITLALSYFD